MEKLNKFLEDLGLENMNPRFKDGDLKILFLLQNKYVAVNMEKRAFISSSTSYEFPVVEAEDFMHSNRGLAARTKFGL